MNEYRHHVSGFFAHRDEAESGRNTLPERGISNEQMHIFSTETTSSSPAQQAKSDGVLEDVLVDGAIGTAVGTGIGALGSVALAVANVSLFVASPLLAPLMLLGWGATIGGLVGATAGASSGAGNKEGWLSDLIGDAIANGQVVLVVETRTPQETDTARELIQASVGASTDTNMV